MDERLKRGGTEAEEGRSWRYSYCPRRSDDHEVVGNKIDGERTDRPMSCAADSLCEVTGPDERLVASGSVSGNRPDEEDE